ncbi:MAG: DUF1554 domain-containing protein [Leptospiraceae bacterium]|nr:DUF1554 domain-containing protein [Leptospiraceae bacterium]
MKLAKQNKNSPHSRAGHRIRNSECGRDSCRDQANTHIRDFAYTDAGANRRVLMVVAMALFSAISFRCSEPFPELDALSAVLIGNTLDNRKFIFLTSNAYDGNLKGTSSTGIEGADAICAQEKNANYSSLPGFASEYQALLASAQRRACTSANCSTSGASEHLDWVLTANQEYLNPSGTTIMTTNGSGVVDFSSSSLATAFTTEAGTYWTGLTDSPAWTTDVSCSDWSSNASGDSGMQGTGSATNVSAIGSFGNQTNCNNARRFLCVRQ